VRLILLMLIALLVLVVIFAVQNPGAVQVEFLTIQGELSLLLVTLAAFGLGVIAGVFGMMPYYVRSRRRLRGTRKELKQERKPGKESTAPTRTAPATEEKAQPGTESDQEGPESPGPKRGREYGEP